METNFKQLHNLYTKSNSIREEYTPLWSEVSRVTGIRVDIDYMYNNKGNKSEQLDQYVDDPTTAISVTQAGDYMLGITWGTGSDALEVVPSDYVTDLTDAANVKPYYDFVTNRLLKHMNMPEAGLFTAAQPYSYDQVAFGTSGIGAFPNRSFKSGIAENALLFRNYGVDNVSIMEGKSGLPEYVFATYHWKINRIVGEFCSDGDQIHEDAISKLPKRLKKAWADQDYDTDFEIVFAMYPRADFDPRLKGKRGMRYRGSWFMADAKDGGIFYEEDFAERAIMMARAVKVRGEDYGRSSGTMLISTIKAVNFMVGQVIEVIEKMNNPALGVFNNALFGDSVLDTSPNGLTVFNASMGAGSKDAIFPLADVGDPSALVNFLIPYLNEKIATAFKIDLLLDFSSAKDMTATESLQRYAIRGKSLAGLLQQQKTELWHPLVKRCMSILQNLNQLGVNPELQEEEAARLMDLKPERVIPAEVLQVMESGKPWYEIRFKNELEKLPRTEAIENTLQMINATTAIANLNPDIVAAVDWYEALKDINDNLDANTKLLYSKTQYTQTIQQNQAMQQAMMASELGKQEAGAQRDLAQAQKAQSEAR